MKNKSKTIGRLLAGSFSRAGLMMGILQIALSCGVLMLYRHHSWDVQLGAVGTVLLVCEIIRMVVTMKFSRQLSRRALSPIAHVVETAQHISASSLSERIDPYEGEEELRELRIVLNDMFDRLESGYNAQKQFMSDASHELRTPISVIQGYADMLDRWGKSDPEVRDESIAAIRSEAAGMKELVEQLLYIARHEGSAAPYQMEYLDLSELIDELARDTRLIDEKHTIQVLVNEKCVVHADRAAIKQALRVFIDNAIKYTPVGGHIALGCLVEKKWCRLTVADDGPGIAHEDMEHIFERFYRSSSARGSSVDGHGLGLSIARLIVRAHGGRIEVQSKPGSGSRFHILLLR